MFFVAVLILVSVKLLDYSIPSLFPESTGARAAPFSKTENMGRSGILQ
jgi:hypothetical protein